MDVLVKGEGSQTLTAALGRGACGALGAEKAGIHLQKVKLGLPPKAPRTAPPRVCRLLRLGDASSPPSPGPRCPQRAWGPPVQRPSERRLWGRLSLEGLLGVCSLSLQSVTARQAFKPACERGVRQVSPRAPARCFRKYLP